MGSLYTAYKKNKLLALGGNMSDEDKANISGAADTVSNLGIGLIDATTKGDPLTGRTSIGATTGKGALAGAALGTKILPGWGTAAGAVLGAGFGLLKGNAEKNKAQSELNTSALNSLVADRNRLVPGTLQGNHGAEYANGGQMVDPPVKRKPIIVTNPNDPRLKAYSDSLNIYNATKGNINKYKNLSPVEWEKVFDRAPINQPSSFNAYVRLGKKNGSYPTPENVYNFPNSNGDGIGEYKKPVQPVVYQKPQATVKPTNVTGKELQNNISDPNVEMYVDENNQVAWRKKIQPIVKPKPIEYPIHQVQGAQKGNITIHQGQQATIPEPTGQPVYGPSNGLIGYHTDKGFQPTLRRDHLAKNNQADIDLLNDPAKLNEYADKTPRYANGGDMTKFAQTGTGFSAPLARMFMSGGKAKSLSSDNAMMIGNSHAAGGIDIPGMGAEVEGGETTKGDYVFSRKLGFAALHKPIAIAKGKIEMKPLTTERLISLRLLNKKEDNLKQQQELIKLKMGVQ